MMCKSQDKIKVVNHWNKATPTLLKGHTSWVTDLYHQGDRLVSCAGDGTVRIWDLSTKKAQVLQGHEAALKSVAYHPSG